MICAIALCGWTRLGLAQDATPLDSDKALMIARRCTEAVAKLRDLPLKVTPDVEKCRGVEAHDRAGLVIPDVKLSSDTLRKLDREIVPVGMLYLHRVTPIVVEQAVSADQQRKVEIAADDQKAVVSAWQLGVTRVADRNVLVVYGSAKAPLLVTTLIETTDTGDAPLALNVQAAGDNRGVLLLTIAREYRAAIPVAGQD